MTEQLYKWYFLNLVKNLRTSSHPPLCLLYNVTQSQSVLCYGKQMCLCVFLFLGRISIIIISLKCIKVFLVLHEIDIWIVWKLLNHHHSYINYEMKFPCWVVKYWLYNKMCRELTWLPLISMKLWWAYHRYTQLNLCIYSTCHLSHL